MELDLVIALFVILSHLVTYSLAVVVAGGLFRVGWHIAGEYLPATAPKGESE